MEEFITIKKGEGWEEFIKMIRGFNSKVEQAIKDGLFASGLIVANKAARKVPHKTGILKKSITTEYAGNGIQEVGSNEKYAAIHEYGGTFTRNQAWGRPTRPYTVTYKEHAYLRRGLSESETKIGNIFDKVIQEIMVVAD